MVAVPRIYWTTRQKTWPNSSDLMEITVGAWDLLYLYRAIVLFSSHAPFLGLAEPPQDVSQRLSELTGTWQPMLESRRHFFGITAKLPLSRRSEEPVRLRVTMADLALLEETLRTVIEQAACFSANLKVHVGPLSEVAVSLTRILKGVQTAQHGSE